MRPFLPAYPSLMNALPFDTQENMFDRNLHIHKEIEKVFERIVDKDSKKTFTISWRDSGRVEH